MDLERAAGDPGIYRDWETQDHVTHLPVTEKSLPRTVRALRMWVEGEGTPGGSPASGLISASDP